MAQLFTQRENRFLKAAVVVVLMSLAGAGAVTYALWWSPYMTRVGVVIDQPVPFSHAHHVGGLVIDCRYCHTTVETAASAGMPPTETCMTCHSQIWRDTPALAPVRESLLNGVPIAWNRVYDLPEFTYFDHSIHVRKGVACVTCHGRVDRMPLIYRATDLYMKTCLECHRDPQPLLVRPEAVFRPTARPILSAGDRESAEPFHVNVTQLTDCSVCHR